MSRLNTMSRFAEDIEDVVVVSKCTRCCHDLCEGHDVVEYEGDYYCDDDCLVRGIGAKRVVL